MATQSCTPGDLVNESKCFDCLSEKQNLIIQTHLLAVIAKVDPSPGSLLAAASGFQVLTIKQLLAVQASLLCQINGGTP